MEDVTPLVESAARGGQLLPAEIQAVAACLRSAHHIRKHLAPLAAQVPTLAGVARGIADLSALIQAIERTIGPRGEVLDSASPPLRGLRRAVRETHDRLLERLQRTLASAMGQGIAQESIITERDGRYVIPIKAESRGQLRGVVHDLSSSGATVFVEPLDAVDLGNAWREARADEAHEIERVLRRLSDAIGAESGPIRAAVAALGEIDFAFAKARLAEELDAGLPQESADQGWLVEAPAEFRLQTARHPLLSGDVVPIALAIGGESRGMLVTGPNTGGKTVALKTVGLLALMAQAGLPVPAEVGSQFPVYGSVFADIGDEQSIEQSLSTFSSHMRNIIQIVNEAGPETLVLLDELGAGTDPAEGTALGRAVLQHLLDVGATVVATTHHGELKLFAAEAAGMINASVEFDPQTLAAHLPARGGPARAQQRDRHRGAAGHARAAAPRRPHGLRAVAPQRRHAAGGCAARAHGRRRRQPRGAHRARGGGDDPPAPGGAAGAHRRRGTRHPHPGRTGDGGTGWPRSSARSAPRSARCKKGISRPSRRRWITPPPAGTNWSGCARRGGACRSAIARRPLGRPTRPASRPAMSSICVAWTSPARRSPPSKRTG